MARFLPGPAVPSCPPSVAVPGLLPAPRSPPPKVRCHSQLSAWQQWALREFQSRPRGARAGGKPEPLRHRSRASAGLSLPASLLSTRDHVVITKDSSGLPARNAVAAAPTHPLSEGKDQGTGPAQHLSLPCPSVPRDTGKNLSLASWAHTGGLAAPGPAFSEALCPAEPQPGRTCRWMDSQRKPPSLPLVKKSLEDAAEPIGHPRLRTPTSDEPPLICSRQLWSEEFEGTKTLTSPRPPNTTTYLT